MEAESSIGPCHHGSGPRPDRSPDRNLPAHVPCRAAAFGGGHEPRADTSPPPGTASPPASQARDWVPWTRSSCRMRTAAGEIAHCRPPSDIALNISSGISRGPRRKEQRVDMTRERDALWQDLFGAESFIAPQMLTPKSIHGHSVRAGGWRLPLPHSLPPPSGLPSAFWNQGPAGPPRDSRPTAEAWICRGKSLGKGRRLEGDTVTSRLRRLDSAVGQNQHQHRCPWESLRPPSGLLPASLAHCGPQAEAQGEPLLTLHADARD